MSLRALLLFGLLLASGVPAQEEKRQSSVPPQGRRLDPGLRELSDPRLFPEAWYLETFEKDFEKALGIYKKITRSRNPRLAMTAHLRILHIYFESGRFEELRQQLYDLREKRGISRKDRLWIDQALRRIENFRKNSSFLQRIEKARKTLGELSRLPGKTEGQARRLEKARKELAAAIRSARRDILGNLLPAGVLPPRNPKIREAHRRIRRKLEELRRRLAELEERGRGSGPEAGQLRKEREKLIREGWAMENRFPPRPHWISFVKAKFEETLKRIKAEKARLRASMQARDSRTLRALEKLEKDLRKRIESNRRREAVYLLRRNMKRFPWIAEIWRNPRRGV